MRIRVLAAILLAAMLLLCAPSLAERSSVGGAVYVYPTVDAAEANFALRVHGESLDPETFEILTEAELSGAMFGVYAKDAKGELIPLPDPQDPAKPLTLAGGEARALPQSIDLYVKQTIAPEGYVADAQVYALCLPQTLHVVNRRADTRGVRLEVTLDGATPVAGAVFTLGEHTLVTDEHGVAAAVGLASGTYTLRQESAPEGVTIDEPERTIALGEGDLLRIPIVNSRNATLTLRALGLAPYPEDGEVKTRLVPLDRRYAVYRDETRVGTLETGAALSLPATQAGVVYTLIAESAGDARFSEDTQTHEITLTSGMARALETIVSGTTGFLTARGLPSGEYALEGAAALAFTLDETGQSGLIGAIPSGAYRVVGGGAAVSVTVAPYLPEGEIARAELPYTLTGRVEWHPTIAGAQVRVVLDGALQTYPEADGSFSFVNQSPTPHTLTAVAPEGVLTRVEGTTIYAYPAASVEGETMPGVRVAMAGAETVADGAGRYRFDNLLPGAYTLSFDAPEGYVVSGGAAREVVIEAGEAARVETVEMMRPASVSGILTEDGKPVAGARVTLQTGEHSSPPQPSIAETTTDERGAFAFDGLAKGAYALAFDIAEGAVVEASQSNFIVTAPEQRITLAPDAVRPASLSGRIFHDQNDDGYLTPDEGGLPGARVTLLTGEHSSPLHTIVAEATTDDDGAFAFDGLRPGEYSVSVELPEGMIFSREIGMARMIQGVSAPNATSAAYALAPGEALSGLLAGATDAGAVSGVVFVDADADGRMGADETPMAGAIVSLSNGSEAVTGADGRYRIEHLRAGAYTLRVTLPEGYLFTNRVYNQAGVYSNMPAGDGREAEREIVIARHRENPVVNIGALRTVRLAARACLDTDASGAPHDGDKGVPGARFTLYTVSGELERNVASAVSGEGGVAWFEGLRPGTYRVRAELPGEGYAFTYGVEREIGAWGYGEAITLLNQTETVSFGMTELGRIAGMVFADNEYDGLKTGENGLVADVLLLSDGEVVARMRTDSSGAYAFEGLRAGRYTLRFRLSNGYGFTKNRPDAPSYNSDVAETSSSVADTAPMHLPMGETLLVDVGAYRPCTISGLIWHDLNDDGRYVAVADAKLAGAAVSLLRDGATLAETETDEMGAYRFEGLPPGTYALSFRLPEGMIFARRAQSGRVGLVDGVDAREAATAPFTLAMGERVSDANLGAISTCAVSGQVTADGAPVSNLRVSLGELETVTDDAGRYGFSDLRPGEKALRFMPDAEWAADEGMQLTRTLDLKQGEHLSDASLRLIPGASVSGALWLDGDFDGEWGAGEAPIAGARVTLFFQGEALAKATTDADGRFAFFSLSPGAYALAFEPGAGILMSKGKEGAPFTLQIGQQIERMDAAAYRPSTVQGRVWEDLDANGDMGAGEPSMEGVAVAALDMDGNLLAETVSDAQGNYRLTSLPPVAIRLRATLPEGWLLTDEAEGFAGPVALSMGDAIQGRNIGLLRAGRVGDLVWLDENANGLQDTGEPGVADVMIELWRVMEDGMESLAASTKTNAAGRYRFFNVRPGTYRLCFYPPEGMLPTRPFGALEELDSDLPWEALSALFTEPFDIGSGERALHHDAGLVTQAQADALEWVVNVDQTLHAW